MSSAPRHLLQDSRPVSTVSVQTRVLAVVWSVAVIVVVAVLRSAKRTSMLPQVVGTLPVLVALPFSIDALSAPHPPISGPSGVDRRVGRI